MKQDLPAVSRRMQIIQAAGKALKLIETFRVGQTVFFLMKAVISINNQTQLNDISTMKRG